MVLYVRGLGTCWSVASSFAVVKLRLLLAGGGSLGLGGLLSVASNHDHAEEGADDGGTDEDENNGDADGPDAGEEEVLEGVVIVDEGHQERPHGIVQEYDGGGHEHGEADELVEHCGGHEIEEGECD